jgi:UDP-glucuronate 4-epimerase
MCATMETILVTWSSWFIWFHLSKKLLKLWYKVVWIDNENEYYDSSLKRARREILEKNNQYLFYAWSIVDRIFIENIFDTHSIDKVCNLAAQAWVRYSIENPHVYIDTNIVWFHNVLHAANEHWIKKFVYASSSSVYWKNKNYPYSVEDTVDHQISLYAATKKSNELIAHTYSHLHALPTIGLRFFTVYWPWWRPDMAYYKFAKIIQDWWAIDVYNNGDMRRDFTYIDDIVDWIIKSLWHTMKYKDTPYEIFNLWCWKPEKLETMIDILQDELWEEIKKNYMWMQPGDVYKTYADIEHTTSKLKREPSIWLQEWLKMFWDWWKVYNN